MTSIKSFTCVNVERYSGRRISISHEKSKMMFYWKKIIRWKISKVFGTTFPPITLNQTWKVKIARYFARWTPVDFPPFLPMFYRQIWFFHLLDSLFSREGVEASFTKKISSFPAFRAVCAILAEFDLTNLLLQLDRSPHGRGRGRGRGPPRDTSGSSRFTSRATL